MLSINMCVVNQSSRVHQTVFSLQTVSLHSLSPSVHPLPS